MKKLPIGNYICQICKYNNEKVKEKIELAELP